MGGVPARGSPGIFMKNKSARPPVVPEPSENDIREYAYHLYLQGRCEPDHDVDHWLEATACLKAASTTVPYGLSGIRAA